MIQLDRSQERLLLGSFGVGVAAVLVAVDVLLTGHGTAAGQHHTSEQRNREEALHRGQASESNSKWRCASGSLFATVSSQMGQWQ